MSEGLPSREASFVRDSAIFLSRELIYRSMLNLNWYAEAPIDFEHKNYLLLDYVMKVDESYASLRLSPYLLWTQKLVSEMDVFLTNYRSFVSGLPKRIDSVEDGRICWVEIRPPAEVGELMDIIDYSRPILESKVKIGYKLFERYPQILY